MYFSVITINRNNSKGLERTIKSVISQDESLFEFIIIDGASTDGSLDVIRKYEQNINYYISEPDKGVYDAMNKGIVRAENMYTIFMNSGDEFTTSDVLHKVSKYELDTDFIFGGWIRVKDGKQLSICLPEERITLYKMYYRASSCFCHQATFNRTSVLKELEGYDEQLIISADICFLLKAIGKYNKTYKNLPICIARFDVTGMSSDNEGLTIMNNEITNYFKGLFPYIYNDYIKLHSILRFTPASIIKFIKWKLWKDKI